MRDLAAPDTSPSQRAVKRERASRLAEAIETLPALYREVIVLRHAAGLELRRCRTADGPDRRQRQEHVVPRPAQLREHAGEPAMSPNDSRRRRQCRRHPSPPICSDPQDDPRVASVLATYLADFEAGRRPSREELLRSNPEIAEALADWLDVVEFVQSAAASAIATAAHPPAEDALPPDTVLGEYRLVREIGRGGMGIVYEA